MTYEEVHYSKKDHIKFPVNTEIRGMCVGMDIRVWENGGRNKKVGQTEFIYRAPLGRDSVFNVVL